MTFRLVSAVLALASLAGCGKSSDAPPASPQPPPIDYVGAARKALHGSWQSSCAEGESFSLLTKANLGITKLSQIELSDDTIKEVAYITSSSCESRDIEVTAAGSFALNEVKTVDAGTARIKINEYRVKPLTEFGVRVLNISKWCGISDWAIDQERDVTADTGKEKCFHMLGTETAFSLKEESISLEIPNLMQSAGARTKLQFKRVNTGSEMVNNNAS